MKYVCCSKEQFPVTNLLLTKYSRPSKINDTNTHSYSYILQTSPKITLKDISAYNNPFSHQSPKIYWYRYL